MLEAEGLQVKGQAMVMNRPLLWQIKKFPLSAAFGASVVVGVRLPPPAVFLGGIPDDLWIRADQKIVPPAFQLFSFSTVYDLVIVPVLCNPHSWLLHVFM